MELDDQVVTHPGIPHLLSIQGEELLRAFVSYILCDMFDHDSSGYQATDSFKALRQALLTA